jgi:lambda repressor-like predicted transcriptional regulator
MAAVTAAASLAIVFLGRLTRRGSGEPFIAIAGRLAAVQISAFVAMEILERLGAGAPMHDLTTILPVGVAAQAIVALAGAWLLRLVLHAADIAGSLARSLPTTLPRAERILSPAVFAAPRELWLQRRSSRAPPLPS